jgi:hypothetical protein
MNDFRVLLLCGLVTTVPAWAVYAPLPEPEQQKDWSVTAKAGVIHDSNIFGSQDGRISSMVYSLSPSFAYNGSLSDQTFAAFGYTLALDHFQRRPGRKTVDSHDVTGRIAHAFGPANNLDVSDTYQIAKNPESLLAGVPLNTDQSYKRNELNGRYEFSPAPKFGLALKARSILYRYDNANLARSVDRTENLFGLAGNYDLLPETNAVVEFRHEDIYYRKEGESKNKHTNFALVGFDYAIAKKLSLTTRVGNEWRDRAAESSTSSPYAELSAKYDYAPRSFVTAGYVYTFEETSNVATYNDTQVNRFFVNVQHAITGLIVASTSVDYEPSQLQGRRGHSSDNETTTRIGCALTWLPDPHWAVSLTFDYDHVSSDAPGRNQNRNRGGVSGQYSF